MTTQGGLEGIRTAKKVFYRNFTNYRYIICSYEVLITKNTKEETVQPSEKLHPKGGPLGRRRSEKILVEILRTSYIFGADIGSLSQKTQNYIKFKPLKN